jgi:uncharacterized protein
MTQQEQWFPGHLRDLDPDECRSLLAASRVGRVAYCEEDGPVVLPVNHIVEDGDVLFATSPHSALARRFRSGPAAFEVDDFDPYNQTGWSVLVRGTARLVEYGELPDRRPSPWVAGTRNFVVRITPDTITGRRLLPA